jgi:hypothetical protein
VLLPWNKPARVLVDAHQVSARIASPKGSVNEVTIPTLKNGDEAGYGYIADATRSALKALAEKNIRSVRAVDMEIADAFTFYDVLDIDARVVSPAELERLAGLGLADSLGIDASELAIRCAVQWGGRSVVVCAIPIVLLDALGAAVNEAGCKMRRLEPAFSIFLNRHRASCGRPDAVIARLSGTLLMLGLRADGRWRAFATEHISDLSWDALRDGCIAFCNRVCVPEPDQMPVWFEATVDDVPTELDGRWKRFPNANAI